MKILIIGLGSIGRRHMNILLSKKDISVAALRSRKGTLSNPSEIQEFDKIQNALDFKPDGVIVSTPTSSHINDALPFLKQGCKVLIEKPIAHELKDALVLEQFQGQVRVAYCMRFLPIYQKLKEFFVEDKPFKVGFKRSFYLPKWHPYAAYQEEYTARKDLGGGVLRTLSHEIDLTCHWFGEIESICGLTDKLSHLEMDVDDYSFFSIKYKTGVRSSFELDFYAPVNINEGNAHSSKGHYRWDMNKIEFCDYENDTYKTIYESNDQDVSAMYDLQMDDFMQFVDGEKSNNADYFDAIEVMQIINEIDG